MTGYRSEWPRSSLPRQGHDLIGGHGDITPPPQMRDDARAPAIAGARRGPNERDDIARDREIDVRVREEAARARECRRGWSPDPWT